MNNYTFNSHVDFGIFCKVNYDYLVEVFDRKNGQGALLIAEFIRLYEATQGGCPCSIKKRTSVAVDDYKQITNSISTHEPAMSAVKELLGDPTGVEFKENAGGSPFLTF